ncbi:hypothetical protein LOZ51_003257 [Ophidiomyces ophidiicola]|nr:hypothetical protein LOZ55_004021 [Ophidiomyces ophidiicola]KAI1984652.1 hypothetical protein LOZ54_004475 [Ophidiomyces ophidiicola]KAI1997094.1 hypothetical protein LOZ51_003257 [Ophidiomyces ophidiicola]
MQQWMIGLGFVVAQWVGYGCSLLPGILSWRLPLSLQVAPAIVLAAGALFLPESPRWLIEHNKPDNGRQVLCRLRGTHAHLNQKSIDQEFYEIQKAISQERLSSAKSWAEFFRCPAKRRRVFLGAGIQALTQCSGINVIAYYGPRIYAGLGFSTSQSLMIIGISGALAWTWNTLCLFILDHVGRRKLLIPSFIGMGATLCVEVALFQAFDPQTSQNDNALRAQVAMYFMFTLCFTSLGVISWIYPSEIFPTAIRARGTSVATVVNWSLNLVFAQCSPIALSRLGYKYFYFFVTFNWAGAILVWAFFPETLGKTLEELDGVFEPKLKNNTPSSSGYASAEKPSIETRSESKTIEPA